MMIRRLCQTQAVCVEGRSCRKLVTERAVSGESAIEVHQDQNMHGPDANAPDECFEHMLQKEENGRYPRQQPVACVGYGSMRSFLDPRHSTQDGSAASAIRGLAASGRV